MRRTTDYFGTAGEETGTVEEWTAPSNVFEVRPRLMGGWGDSGEATGTETEAGDSLGKGHVIESWATGISPGDTLYIRVGGYSTDGSEAWPDGGAGATATEGDVTATSGSGGGSSSIRLNADERDATLVLAAGGAGAPVYAASGTGCVSVAPATNGGYETGNDGEDATGCSTTDAAGGSGGAESCSTGDPAEDGTTTTIAGSIDVAAATGGAGGGWCGGEVGEVQHTSDGTEVNISGSGSGSSFIGGLSEVTFHTDDPSIDRDEPRGGYVEVVWTYTEVYDLEVTSATPDQVELAWNGWAYGEYEVYRHTESTNVVEDGTLIGTTTDQEFTDTGVTEATNYYQVVPKSATGDTGDTSAVVESVADPDTPTITDHNSWTYSISLFWDEIPGATEYRIYMNDEESSSFSDYSHVATSTEGDLTETIDELDPGYWYHFRITSYDGSSESAPSTDYRAGTRFQAPSEFSVDAVDGTDIDVSMTNNAAGGEGFKFYKALADPEVVDDYITATDPITADMDAEETIGPGTTLIFTLTPDQIGNDDHWFHPGLFANPESDDDYYQEYVSLFNADNTAGAVTDGQDVDLGIIIEDASAVSYSNPTKPTMEVGTKHTFTVVIEDDERVTFYYDDEDLGTEGGGTFSSFPVSELFRGYGDGSIHRGFTGDAHTIHILDGAMDEADVAAYIETGTLSHSAILSYEFGDGSGTTVSDSVANNNATIQGEEDTDFTWEETTTRPAQGEWELDGTAPIVGQGEEVSYTTETTTLDGQKYFLRGSIYTEDREVFHE